MKHLITLTIATSLAIGGPALADTLTLSVQTASAEGTLRAAVFDSQQAFDADRIVVGAVAPTAIGTTLMQIEGLNSGTYGIAIFQDLNENEKLDRNLFGAPSEPFGFSNNPKIGFSVPKFEDFKFLFEGAPTQLAITLNGG